MFKKMIFLLGLSLILIACGEKYEGDFSIEVGDFSYIDQDNQAYNKEELDGKFWVANFIFTNCETICPPMTSNMARLQSMLEDEGIDNVELVSFSVDPTNDTPEILKEYIEVRGGTFDNWHVLTGYSNDDISEFALQSFNVPIVHPDPEETDQVIHPRTFYLVSPDGNAINGYNGESAEEMQQIVEDIQSMN
ncbi:SCO family protein [Gracilibacillus alcaliphilus]|uniref:SCO family protein n=1 Tax=Gracilibacillus alcaliphilus TaxID=1401441 RepID=UPI00195E13A4|nr:SCO family protein [Gracilibacillus alcaliphilus]MBM7679368.1 protein SCO1/2 [Gracilibacillus alcaliphilus]